MRLFPTLALSCLTLAACDAGVIQSVEHYQTPVYEGLSPDRKAEIREGNRLVRDRPGARFVVKGRGECGAIRVRFGDGESVEIRPVDFNTEVSVPHTYTGWSGPKKLTAESVENCIGQVSSTVNVETAPLRIAMFGRAASACTPVPSFPPVRAGSRVTVDAISNPEMMISFNGVIKRGIDGSPEVALGPPFNFPFPGLKAHSLVLRIGTQVEQGGKGRSFVANQTGPLEFCINDDVLGDNNGGWGIALTVDETGAE
jgi:hypothetical protein